MTPEELQIKIKETQGVLVYFKNDYCGPCAALRPKVSDLIETKFPKMEMEIVDSFTNPSLPHLRQFAIVVAIIVL